MILTKNKLWGFLVKKDETNYRKITTLCSFPPFIPYKENGLYKTSYIPYIVEDKQMKLGALTDVG